MTSLNTCLKSKPHLQAGGANGVVTLDPRVTPPLGDTAHTKAFAPNIGASLKAYIHHWQFFSANIYKQK